MPGLYKRKSFLPRKCNLKTGLSSRSNDPSSNIEKILPFLEDSRLTNMTSSNSWSNRAHELVILHLKLCKCPCCIRQILRGKSLHFENLNTSTPRMTMSLRTSPHNRGELLQAVNSLKMTNTNANTCRFALHNMWGELEKPQHGDFEYTTWQFWTWLISHLLGDLDLATQEQCDKMDLQVWFKYISLKGNQGNVVFWRCQLFPKLLCRFPK